MWIVQFFILFVVPCIAALGKKVIVTGGAGRTGMIVFKKLLQRSEYSPVAVVRTESSKKKLIKETNCDSSQVAVCDISDPNALSTHFSGAEKLILCTSAVPQIKKRSIVKVLLLKLIGKTGRPEFRFREGGSPYFVDWLGAKNQFDAAKSAGINQVVVIGSMGGTQKDNFLNTIGKIDSDYLSGNILQWKRKAEMYLASTGLSFTILHPGGLIDKAGGQRQIVLGVDDELLKENSRTIPRSDVAEVAVQALSITTAQRRSIDIISREPDAEGSPVSMDWDKFFSTPGDCKYQS